MRERFHGRLAASLGIVDISNVALLYRLRQCGIGFAMLVGQALSAATPEASRGRLQQLDAMMPRVKPEPVCGNPCRGCDGDSGFGAPAEIAVRH